MGRITKIIAFDSAQRGICKQTYESRWLIQVKGLSGECYTLFPDINYCPCQAFKYQVLNDHSELTCKHILAAWLSSLNPSKIIKYEITPGQFNSLLIYQVSYKNDESID